MTRTDADREAARIARHDWMWALGLLAALAGVSCLFDRALDLI
jgi:hypothetical protein